MHRTTRIVAVVTAVAVVVLLRPDTAGWRALVTAVRAGAPAPRLDTLAALVAGTALWLMATWVVLALGAGALAAAPGRAGVLGRAAVRVVVPRVLRGIVTGGVAGGLLLGPAAVAVAAPAGAHAVSATTTTPGPVWPTSPRAAPPSAMAPPSATATPATPTAPTAPAWPTGAAPSSPATTPPPTTPATPATPTSPTTGPASVVVAPGDSLWSVAAAVLQRDGTAPTAAAVAAAWPAWYAVNRDVVGPDPDLLHPGTRLAAPTATTTPTDGGTP